LDGLFDFTGKVVMITGGSRGLGRAMSIAFAERGASVIVSSRNLESCKALSDEIVANGGIAAPVACHVGKWDELGAAVETAYAALGRVDMLINNAGMSPTTDSSLSTSESLFDKVMAVNCKGPFRLTSLIASRMAAGEGGGVINVSSIGSLRPLPAYAPYAAAKAGLNAITTAHAFEFAPKVRVNAILPGSFETDIANLAPDRAFLSELLSAEELAGVEIVSGDVTDMPRLLRAASECKPERIVHLAALLGKKSDENALLSPRVNCEANINVFEIALALGVPRVVWGSSVAVFGPPNKRAPGEIANEAVHQPLGLYGACKSLTEHYSKYYRRSRGPGAVGLRFSLVHGYGKERTLARGTGAEFLSDLIDKPALGRRGVVPAGNARIDFVYVEAAVRAVVRANQAPEVTSIGLTVGGFRMTLRDAAELSRRIIPGADIAVENGSWGGADHNYDKKTTFGEIGYIAEISMEEGFRRNVEDVRRWEKTA
jgi:NAD(P)-dependent dehydrogenase (short-subunit alcohol dehydrogenase family)